MDSSISGGIGFLRPTKIAIPSPRSNSKWLVSTGGQRSCQPSKELKTFIPWSYGVHYKQAHKQGKVILNKVVFIYAECRRLHSANTGDFRFVRSTDVPEDNLPSQ